MLRRISTIALAMLMLLPVGATAAQAGTAAARTAALYEIVVGTTNGSATAYLSVYNAWDLSVCDDAKDGYRAKAEMKIVRTGQIIARAEAASGVNTCDGGNYANPTPNEKVRVTVWVQDGANGSRKFTRSEDY
ncbi:hypothetical protein ACIA3K_23480 [Micromonospora sp. NPDC051543]|uniref:hypothetical protein n=1 Tax=Micromonospora sp. NPDC051543 TaxID=3364287 RepID=UPI0037B1E6D2